MPKLMYNGEEIIGGGSASSSVSSFNGRLGEVMPQEGDYTAEMVGAATMEQVNTAIQNAKSQEIYSTEETRIGTWIDGKPLYRRVVKAILPSGVTGAPFYTIPNTDEIVSYNVILYYSNTNMYIQFPFQLDAGWGGVVIIDGGLQLRGTATTVFGSPYTAIFEYTKTTDVETIQLDAPERAVYAAAKAEQYSIPSSAVTASSASTKPNEI